MSAVDLDQGWEAEAVLGRAQEGLLRRLRIQSGPFKGRRVMGSPTAPPSILFALKVYSLLKPESGNLRDSSIDGALRLEKGEPMKACRDLNHDQYHCCPLFPFSIYAN